jgi:hypothetical protein
VASLSEMSEFSSGKKTLNKDGDKDRKERYVPVDWTEVITFAEVSVLCSPVNCLFEKIGFLEFTAYYFHPLYEDLKCKKCNYICIIFERDSVPIGVDGIGDGGGGVGVSVQIILVQSCVRKNSIYYFHAEWVRVKIAFGRRLFLLQMVGSKNLYPSCFHSSGFS